jgi:hypothetical protein
MTPECDHLEPGARFWYTPQVASHGAFRHYARETRRGEWPRERGTTF